jgi:hypothetical protein
MYAVASGCHVGLLSGGRGDCGVGCAVYTGAAVERMHFDWEDAKLQLCTGCWRIGKW